MMTTIASTTPRRAAAMMTLTLFLCCDVLAPRALADVSAAKQAYDEGVRKAKAGDDEGAVAAYTKAIALDPNLAGAYNNRGLLRAQGGDCESAIADYDSTLRIDSNHVLAYANRSWCRRQLNDLPGAISDLDAGARLDARNPSIFFHRGVLKYESADLAGARSDLRRSLRIKPRVALAHYYLGCIHNEQGAYPEAVAQYDRAIAIDPTIVDVWLGRGITKRDMGDANGALADFDETIRREPGRAMAWFERALIRYDRGEHESAVSGFRRRCELDPEDQDSSRLFIWLARAAGGEREEASIELAKYVDEERSASKAGWTAQLAGYLLGRIDGDTLLASAKAAEGETITRGRQCEAFFYIGSRGMLEGDDANALSAWRRCVATDMKECVEFSSAVAALARYESRHATEVKAQSKRAAMEAIAAVEDTETESER